MSKLLNSKRPSIHLASEMPDMTDLEYITMPPWWEECTNVKGIPFKKIVTIAGDSDSGKTSFAILAMKQAQEQGYPVLYIETEGKTSKEDFINWGVNPSKVYILQGSIAETIFDQVYDFLKEKIEEDPDLHMLVVFDSLGNVISQHDAERSMADTSTKPGGKGKTNREGLNKIISLREKASLAIILITYTYDNIGSHGKTNAGGKAVNFFSSITYQTSRIGWKHNVVNGKKLVTGVKVLWKRTKNHANRGTPSALEAIFEINKDGFHFVEAKKSKDDDE